MKKIMYFVDVDMKDEVDANDVFELMNKLEKVLEDDERVDDYEIVVCDE